MPSYDKAIVSFNFNQAKNAAYLDAKVSTSTGFKFWDTGTNNGIHGSAVVIDKKGVKHYPAISGEQQ